jgi:hypothetical protein
VPTCKKKQAAQPYIAQAMLESPDGEVATIAGARLACEVLGVGFEGPEDEDAGLWLVALPPAHAARLEEAGELELALAGYRLVAELP